MKLFFSEMKKQPFFLIKKKVAKSHKKRKNFPLWDTNKMVLLLCVCFVLSIFLSLFVFCDDVFFSFLFLFLFLFCVLFSRVEWVWMGHTDETKFPLRVDDDDDVTAFKKYTERRFVKRAQFRRNRWWRWERLTSLFSFVTHINSSLMSLLLYMNTTTKLRLERRNECSLQSRKSSTRTSTKEAWWT